MPHTPSTLKTSPTTPAISFPPTVALTRSSLLSSPTTSPLTCIPTAATRESPLDSSSRMPTPETSSSPSAAPKASTNGFMTPNFFPCNVLSCRPPATPKTASPICIAPCAPAWTELHPPWLQLCRKSSSQGRSPPSRSADIASAAPLLPCSPSTLPSTPSTRTSTSPHRSILTPARAPETSSSSTSTTTPSLTPSASPTASTSSPSFPCLLYMSTSSDYTI